MPPLLAIPTTAGTGSEVTAWAVITDPALMLTLPAEFTAATGIDVLSYCIEAYVSTMESSAIDPMILYGIELIGRSLRVATAQEANRAARI